MRAIFFFLSIFVGFPALSFAADKTPEIIIQDTSGFTRASAEVDELGAVEFSVVDANNIPADGAEIVLTNAETGEAFTRVSVAGNVVFDGIEPGVWTVASSTGGITFTNVGISSGAAYLASTGAALAAGGGGSAIGGGTAAAALGVAAVGGTAVAIGSSTSDDDDGDDLENIFPTPVPTTPVSPSS